MKKKILLVRPPCPGAQHVNWPPLGLCCLAAYLEARDPEVSLKAIDFAVEKFSQDRWRRELEMYQPGILGISVLSLDAPHGVEMARLAKEVDPGILTVCGGAHATDASELCVDHYDVVVQGEGEETFYEIVQGHALGGIKGICYRQDGELVTNPQRPVIRDLDGLPPPLYSLFDMEQYIEGDFRLGAVLGSRGCPYECTFCASQVFWERSIRLRSVEKVTDEVEFMQEKYRFDKISFADDLVNVPRQRAIDLANEIIKRRLHKKVEFYSLIRANKNTVSEEMFERMKEANWKEVSFGIESASPRVLAAMNKNLTPKEASQAIAMARKAGIETVYGNFIICSWDAGWSDVFKTWWFVLTNDVEPLFWVCTPYPGTKLSENLINAGYLDRDYAWIAKIRPGSFVPIARTNRMSKLEIQVAYFISVALQLMVYTLRSKNRGLIRYFGRRALAELWGKVERALVPSKRRSPYAR